MFLSYVTTLLILIVIFKADYHLLFVFFHKKVNKINAKGTSQRVGSVAGQDSANYR